MTALKIIDRKSIGLIRTVVTVSERCLRLDKGCGLILSFDSVIISLEDQDLERCGRYHLMNRGSFLHSSGGDRKGDRLSPGFLGPIHFRIERLSCSPPVYGWIRTGL